MTRYESISDASDWPDEMSTEEFLSRTGGKPLVAASSRPGRTISASDKFLAMCANIGLPEPESEVQFHHTRKWRLDFAWKEKLIAVEIHGGVHTHGRHTRGKGFENDREKMNEAVILGWRVIELSSGMFNESDGRAFDLLERLKGFFV